LDGFRRDRNLADIYPRYRDCGTSNDYCHALYNSGVDAHLYFGTYLYFNLYFYYNDLTRFPAK
jgi:hypothetical protein